LDNFGGAVPFDLGTITDSNGQTTPAVDAFQFFLGFGGTGDVLLDDRRTKQRQFNFVDTMSYSLGRHSLKFGLDYRQLTTPLFALGPNAFETGIFTSQTQVRQNSALQVQVLSNTRPDLPIAPVYKNFSLFAQDEWKPTQRLSLSLGLRWELNPPPTDAYGNLPYTLNQITNLSTSVVAPKGTQLWKTTYHNLAPRIGAAYRLRGGSRRETLIRGGFGIFYDLGNTYASTGYTGVGIASRIILTNVAFPLTAAQGNVPAPSITAPYNSSVTAFDPNLELPYTLQWNVTAEQAIGKSQALTVAYVGSAGRRLLWQHNVFPALLGNSNFTSSAVAILVENGITSDYDALQMQFQRRLSRGLQLLSSYTWSHSIDEASTNFFSRQLLRASSDFDVRHTFQAALTYDVPGHYDNPLARAILRFWSTDARITGRCGLPVEVTAGTFTDASGRQEFLRGDLVAGQPLYLYGSQYPGGRAVNFNAFTVPTAAERAAFQFGNAPRNLLRGFNAWQVDLALRREFPIHERLKLQFRAEAFNIFNHPIFGEIQNNLTTGTAVFGRATTTLNNQLGGLSALYQQGGPRSFQFALKLVF
jgi:hypothetical protein